MKRISIGIHVHSEPERLRATIAYVRANTAQQVELLLLGDGPDPATRASLETLSDLKQSNTDEPRGAAACFNRLASATDADVLVLLESGSLVAPGWLGHLLDAFDADAANGLAGPTTNYAWNEQGVFPQSGASSDEIARTAREAFIRFGTELRTLEPLYSLADFCYAVRREVIERVGAADEGYGPGPCWEMDYNIRAARAGFRGVWACAAYVQQSPFTARRMTEETRRFEASKRRYQDKFCGARVRGEKSDYRSHCRGDACPNFARPALIEIHEPLRKIEPLAAATATAPSDGDVKAAVQVATDGESLVSCIMPTHNRRSFALQAIRYFLRQDYSNLELIIVDDGSDSIADLVPGDARIRYIRLDHKLTVGAKRNLACGEARGQLIAHWDDDDWYPPWRVRAQIRALDERRADACGSSRILFYDGKADRAWEYRYEAPGPSWVAGSTLVYRKSFWNRNRFADIQVGEDSQFVWNGASRSICDLSDARLCVAMIHSANTSPKQTDGAFWHAEPTERIRSLLGDDVNFYRVGAWPMVSCIMPTYNRRKFVPTAIQLFLDQDYPNRELIIVDDGDDRVGDLISDAGGVRYFAFPTRASIGAKRNFACQQAKGEIIAHWDDDDWYAPNRLRYQVAPIASGEADITGLENAFVLQLPEGEFWTTSPQLHNRMFVGDVHGGTLVFRKQIMAEGLRYPETSLGEDAHLLRYAVMRGKRLARLSNPGVFVYIRHGRNAWKEFAPGRFIDPTGWRRIVFPPFFAGVFELYKAAAQI